MRNAQVSKYDKAQCEFQATLQESMGRTASLRELQVMGRQDKEEGSVLFSSEMSCVWYRKIPDRKVPFL